MRNGCKRGLVGVACAIGALIGVAPGTAHALSCGTNLVMAPRGNQTNVPTDTLLWGYSLAGTQLLGPSGEVVALEERTLVVRLAFSERGVIPMLVPSAALQAGAHYTIVLAGGEGADPVEVGFDTAAGPASVLPLPALVSSEPAIGTYWASTEPARWQNLQFQDVRSLGLMLIGSSGYPEASSVDAASSVRDLLIEGSASEDEVAEAPVVEWLSDDGLVSVGLTDCAVWPQGAPDALTARFSTLDLGGNFSAGVDVSLQLPPAEEARAAVADRLAADALAAEEDQRVRAANLARLAEAEQGNGCAMAAAREPRGSRAITAFALAVGLMAFARRRRR